MASGGSAPIRYVSLAEYLLIAEAITGIDARRLARVQANGRSWLSSDGDPDDTESVIVGVAAGERAVADVTAWLEGRIG